MCISNSFLVLLLLIVILVIYVNKDYFLTNEHFGVYKRNPFDNYEDGQTPFNFYEFPIYRKPYMYPQQFYKSYPLPHLSYYEDSVTLH
jgi:hypothetical protein